MYVSQRNAKKESYVAETLTCIEDKFIYPIMVDLPFSIRSVDKIAVVTES